MGDVKLSLHVLSSKFFREETGVFLFNYSFICMALDMTDCSVLLGLTADFTCFPLVNINKDEEDKDEFMVWFFFSSCVGSWGF